MNSTKKALDQPPISIRTGTTMKLFKLCNMRFEFLKRLVILRRSNGKLTNTCAIHDKLDDFELCNGQLSFSMYTNAPLSPLSHTELSILTVITISVNV
jgi:hypothetical protein